MYALSFYVYSKSGITSISYTRHEKKQMLLIALLVFILFALFHKNQNIFLSKIKEQNPFYYLRLLQVFQALVYALLFFRGNIT